MLFDTHTHINDRRFNEDRNEIMEEIRHSDVGFICDVGFDLASSEKSVALAKKYDFCYAVVGCHPHDAKNFSDRQLDRIRALSKQPKVVAIGEIGLDYHYDFSPRNVQRYWFERQLGLALELGMPICIHEREAAGDVMEILKDSGVFSKERTSLFPAKPDGSPDARLEFHCFSGSAEIAAQYVKLGASFGIGGPITYKNARKAVEVVEQTDLCHILLETDCPYLTPVPCRGKRNKPVYVEYVARRIAEIKDVSYEEVAKLTTRNAKRFFGIES